MVEFVTAIGLVFVIEGLLYAALPGRMKNLMKVAEQVPPETMRNVGVIAIAVGVAIVWLARSVLATG
jgi:uncharacterized protein YjeT (DUF2065 family)